MRPWKRKYIFASLLIEPGVVVHTCSPCTQELKQEENKLEASLGYIVKPCLKKPRGWGREEERERGTEEEGERDRGEGREGQREREREGRGKEKHLSIVLNVAAKR
jgi:hypothetical protein